MRIDFATLAFGYSVESGGNTPNWGTSLGQGKGYKINDDPEIDEILKGMIYCSKSPEKMATKIGKGGKLFYGNEGDSPLVISSLFTKVYVNDTLINGGKFVLVITRDTSESHAGRLKLKYGPGNTYESDGEVYTNEHFFDAVREQLGLDKEACWFVSAISVRNQDELVLTTVIVNPDGPEVYADSKDLHASWSELDPTLKDIESNIKRVVGGNNVIYYGVPGSGKSFAINKICSDEQYISRVVFHPDYTFSDFVGQIMPRIENDNGDERIKYVFTPGPFTQIMKDAENDPYHMYYLVIEEINRGNAPAIFGEVFQLLDRKEEEDYPEEYGESEYGISNYDIAREMYNGDISRKVKIPSNLTLLATMNTSDQNVFTLDTAFKRRWSMKHIINDIDACKYVDQDVCGSGITWGTFAKTINKQIIDVNVENLSNEDNRLGAYFVRLNELKNPDLFGEKVLMYLWNDAFKYNHDKVFKPDYRTLDELIEGFKLYGLDVFVDDVSFEEKNVLSTNLPSREKSVEEYLEGKKEHLVAYYNALRNIVKEKVPNSREASTGSLQYAAWRSDDIKKSSFADLQIQSDRILIYTEEPKEQEYVNLGEVIPKDGHHNHYFKLIYNDSIKNKIVDIIIESYEQLKEDK